MFLFLISKGLDNSRNYVISIVCCVTFRFLVCCVLLVGVLCPLSMNLLLINGVCVAFTISSVVEEFSVFVFSGYITYGSFHFVSVSFGAFFCMISVFVSFTFMCYVLFVICDLYLNSLLIGNQLYSVVC